MYQVVFFVELKDCGLWDVEFCRELDSGACTVFLDEIFDGIN